MFDEQQGIHSLDQVASTAAFSWLAFDDSCASGRLHFSHVHVAKIRTCGFDAVLCGHLVEVRECSCWHTCCCFVSDFMHPTLQQWQSVGFSILHKYEQCVHMCSASLLAEAMVRPRLQQPGVMDGLAAGCSCSHFERLP